MKLDTDAILWSAPERERAGRPLLVLLHGYGSHEGDLFGLSPYLPLEPVIASLRAPLQEGGGFAWFTRSGNPGGNPAAEVVDEAARVVSAWLDTVESTSVSLLGFSQGAAVSLQLLRHAPGRFRATVALSGYVTSGVVEGDEELAANRPPVFWGRGTTDRIIPESAIERTEEWLPAHTTATVRIYEDLPHSISQPELTDIGAFLRESSR